MQASAKIYDVATHFKYKQVKNLAKLEPDELQNALSQIASVPYRKNLRRAVLLYKAD